MKTDLLFIDGRNECIADLSVKRLIPCNESSSVGPFVLLDHIYPKAFVPGICPKRIETHPHRGVITFTYVLDGEMDYIDSLGNRGVARAGGAHWLNSGSGIIHAEQPGEALLRKGGRLHAVQFWIKLPADGKDLPPEYECILPEMFPKVEIPGNAGEIRILLGKMGSLNSPVRTVANAFLYHIKLSAKSSYLLNFSGNHSYGVFVPGNDIMANSLKVGNSQLIINQKGHSGVSLVNDNFVPTDMFVFGGEMITESFILRGPFVTSTVQDMEAAYRDYFLGVYGSLSSKK